MSDIINNSAYVFDRLAKTDWIVLIEIDGKLTYVVDPGLAGRPWVGRGEYGRRRAIAIADEAKAEGYKAEAVTWNEGFSRLLKAFGGAEKLEDALFKRMVDKQKHIQQQPLKTKPLNE